MLTSVVVAELSRCLLARSDDGPKQGSGPRSEVGAGVGSGGVTFGALWIFPDAAVRGRHPPVLATSHQNEAKHGMLE
jgi:hypothetical protein